MRLLVAILVALVVVEEILSAATPNIASRQRLLREFVPGGIPAIAHLLAFGVAVGLATLTAGLVHGKQRAARLTMLGLGGLAVLNLVKGLDWGESLLDVTVVAVILLSRPAYNLGSRPRPRMLLVYTAVAAWIAALALPLVSPALSGHGRVLVHAVHHAVRRAAVLRFPTPTVVTGWVLATDVLIAAAIAISAVALRSSLRPSPSRNTNDPAERARAEQMLAEYGDDSLCPFVLRPDKAFFFRDDGMLAYRVFGDTAVVSGDPIAAPGRAGAVLQDFRATARAAGWHVVIWGASARHLGAYRSRGLHAIRVGEEAFIDPSSFTLDGRAVRKLRQSVQRLARRNWRILVSDGVELDDAAVEAIAVFEARWRAEQDAITGFAMGMGPYVAACRPGDVYVRAFAPDGSLGAVMRFAEYAGRLSLDTMHRIGDTPNGLTEALVCHALEHAKGRGVPDVSLNYAGLSHLARHSRAGRGGVDRLTRTLSRVVGSRFRMTGLVRFDEKFPVEWRPRFLVCETRLGMPRAALRVLQAEGYIGTRGHASTHDADSPAAITNPVTALAMPTGQ